jgi:hypothetical protein
MKALAFLFLFCGAACGAETVTTNVVGDVTTVITERTGPRPRRFETSYRSKKKIMFVMASLNGSGKRDVSCIYFADGDMLLNEVDDDGDGFFEEVAIFMPNTDDMEIFTREKDGSVKPVSTEKIRLVKKVIATTSETNDKLFFSKKKPSVEEIGKLLKQNREKLEKLGEQELAATNASPDVTTKVEEHKDKDGNPDLRIESTYRGKNKILEVTSRRNTFGRMVVWLRKYILNGNSIATEIVSPGDGKFLSLIVRSPDKHEFEIFKRNGDESITPASAAEIDSFKGID